MSTQCNPLSAVFHFALTSLNLIFLLFESSFNFSRSHPRFKSESDWDQYVELQQDISSYFFQQFVAVSNVLINLLNFGWDSL
jgi:hypothetical protein